MKFFFFCSLIKKYFSQLRKHIERLLEGKEKDSANLNEEPWQENANEKIIYKLKLSDDCIHLIDSRESLANFIEEISDLTVSHLKKKKFEQNSESFYYYYQESYF